MELGLQEGAELLQVDRVGLQGLGAEVLLVLTVEEKLGNRLLYGHPMPSHLEGQDHSAGDGDLRSAKA